jgi:hypothetical protein
MNSGMLLFKFTLFLTINMIDLEFTNKFYFINTKTLHPLLKYIMDTSVYSMQYFLCNYNFVLQRFCFFSLIIFWDTKFCLRRERLIL